MWEGSLEYNQLALEAVCVKLMSAELTILGASCKPKLLVPKANKLRRDQSLTILEDRETNLL